MNTPLYEKIYHYIIEQIEKEILKHGDRVPSEKELADKFNVSRITSKKALDLLAQSQIIERIRGKGSFVAKPQHEVKRKFDNNVSTELDQKRRSIALIIPDFSDSFGTSLIKSIEEVCTRNNCKLMIRRTIGKIEEEERAIIDLLNDGVEGLIVTPVHGENYNVEILKLSLKDFPLVLVDRYLKGIPASTVCTDNRTASESITNYLFSLGHKNIGFISSSPVGTSAIEERVQGFHLAYSKQGIKLNPDYMVLNLLSSLPQNHDNEDLYNKDYQELKEFIKKHPSITSFVACEHYFALLLTEVIHDLGKNVPEDYSVVCFDSPNCTLGKAVFTHVKQNEQEMGKRAVDQLLNHSIKGEKNPEHMVIDFQIIEGKSTRKL